MVKQEDFRQVLETKLGDRFWRINNLYYIMNDKGEKVQFKINRVQYLLYTAMWWLNIILKSRQHGITTFICILFLDAVLFNSNVRAGIIAHRDEDVQRIFADKIKFAYDNLPDWLKAARPTVKDDARALLFNNNSGIYVGMSFRSGTLQYLHISEYGWICAHFPQRAKEIKSGALNTIHEGGIVFIEATAEGMGNDFHRMCEIAEAKTGRELSKMDFKFHFFAWWQKPENTTDPKLVPITADMEAYFIKKEMKLGIRFTPGQKAWYAKKKEVLGIDIYKEHPTDSQEAFLASLEGSYYGHGMILARQDGRLTKVPYNPAALVHLFTDLGDMHTAIGFVQFIQNRIHVIDYYEDNEGLGLPGYAKVLQTKPYVYAKEVYCGSDIFGSNKRSMQTTTTTVDVAASLGIHLVEVAPHSVAEGIAALRDVVLPQMWIDEARCERFIKCLTNYHKEKNELASTEETPVYKNNPAHDEWSHGADMGRYMAIAYLYNTISGKRLGTTRPQARHVNAEPAVPDLLSV